MTLFAIAVVGLALACLPAVLTLMNVNVLRTPRLPNTPPRLAILIPARNEEAGIGDCVRAALASRHADIEVVVLDDHSTDETAGIVRAIAAEDGRVRLETPPPLPPGWSGKQHACLQLSRRTDRDLMLFLDADVRLEPEGAARLAGWLRAHDLDLVSGVPRQIMGSWAERLVIPTINLLLLGYLPMAMMRTLPLLGLAAGCGQMMLVRRAPYEAVGGHEACKHSFHDGLLLPRAFRAHGHTTDLVNGARLARVRMYDAPRAVWSGFLKNATEGMATPIALPVWTILLVGAHVLPWLTLLAGAATDRGSVIGVSSSAIALLYATRLLQAWRVREPLMTTVWHPLTVLAALAIQWTALVQKARGVRPTWRGRTRPSQA